VCGNSALLDGPATPPAGSVRVDPGTDLADVTGASDPGTTFWLAPGVHTLGGGAFDQVVPKDGYSFVGAPGAILDGRHLNRDAFTQHARGVAIRNLTIQGFGTAGGNANEGVVNHDGGGGWTIEHSTIRGNAGAGLLVGSDDVVRYDCLTGNGQYGLSAYAPSGVDHLLIDRNEISYNNTDDWDHRIRGCGCAAGAKFWNVRGATIAGNWVHHNRGVGLWADTDNVAFLVAGNVIEENDDEAIVYEISYNAVIHGNTIRRNALVKGREYAARGDTFTIAAIYISESGGDRRTGGPITSLDISGNHLEDNWGGVALWENADRFCGSPANTSGGYCTVGGAATLTTCVPGTIDAAPYDADCRWRTQNVSVRDNDFLLDRAAIGCRDDPCGQQALLSNYGTYPSWSPYRGRAVQEDITFHQNNRFRGNRYVGDWRFTAYEPGRMLDFTAWRAAPYGQDLDSSMSSGG